MNRSLYDKQQGRLEYMIKSSQIERLMPDFLDREPVRQRSHYTKCLRNWLSFYSREQILTCFTRDIERRPESLVRNLYQFCGLSTNLKLNHDQLTQRLHSTGRIKIPPCVKRHLEKDLYNHNEDLKEIPGCSLPWKS